MRTEKQVDITLFGLMTVIKCLVIFPLLSYNKTIPALICNILHNVHPNLTFYNLFRSKANQMKQLFNAVVALNKVLIRYPVMFIMMQNAS